MIDRAECKQIRRPLALAASFPADSAAGTVAGAATAGNILRQAEWHSA